jgi:hypothetical protein
MPRVGHARWIGDGVGDAVIHRAQPGRIRIADVRELHRRGLAREHEHPRAVGVTGEIDQDVHTMAADEVGKLGVIQRGDVVPTVHARADRRRHRVPAARHAAVAEDLEPLAVAVVEQRRQEFRDRMIAKVGRDVADAQPTLRIAVIPVRCVCR